MIRKNWKTSLIWFIIRVLEVSYIFMLCVTYSQFQQRRQSITVKWKQTTFKWRQSTVKWIYNTVKWSQSTSVEVRVLWSQDSELSNEFRVLSRFVYYIILYLQSFSGKKKVYACLFSVKDFNINRLVDRSLLAILAKYLTQKNICLLFLKNTLLGMITRF